MIDLLTKDAKVSIADIFDLEMTIVISNLYVQMKMLEEKDPVSAKLLENARDKLARIRSKVKNLIETNVGNS